jgi:imidazolonepropionase-like amidohydrolase
MAERADLVVKNGKIVSSQGIIEGGLAIKDGKFIAVGKDSALPDAQKVIDVGGKHILPGLIDPEVHLGIHRRSHQRNQGCGLHRRYHLGHAAH